MPRFILEVGTSSWRFFGNGESLHEAGAMCLSAVRRQREKATGAVSWQELDALAHQLAPMLLAAVFPELGELVSELRRRGDLRAEPWPQGQAE